MELRAGRVYRAKTPANCKGLYNDRLILFMNDTHVQYDGPAVGFGRKYPTVDRARFEAWAGADVTDALPKGEWQEWGAVLANPNDCASCDYTKLNGNRTGHCAMCSTAPTEVCPHHTNPTGRLALAEMAAEASGTAAGQVGVEPVPAGRSEGAATAIARHELSSAELSLLLFFETAAVDYGGLLQSVRMNAEDFAIAERWNKAGFVRFGRVAANDIKARGQTGEYPRTHWCVLSEAAWAAAHVERRARCQRLTDRLTIRRMGLEAQD